MSFTIDEMQVPAPTAAVVEEGRLRVELEDGRTIIVPIEWYPRLAHGTAEEHARVELSYVGLHWPDLDEDLSIAGLLAGGPSCESEESFSKWLERRAAGLPAIDCPSIPLPDWWDDPIEEWGDRSELEVDSATQTA